MKVSALNLCDKKVFLDLEEATGRETQLSDSLKSRGVSQRFVHNEQEQAFALWLSEA
jgi:hypothetical protein